MHWRVTDDQVSTDDVSRDPRRQKYSIRVPENGVVLNHVAGIAGRDETDAEVIPLLHESISTKPVPTDPVAASAARKSYTSTRRTEISIAYGSAAFYIVEGPTRHENAGKAVRGRCCARHFAAGAVEQANPVSPKPLD